MGPRRLIAVGALVAIASVLAQLTAVAQTEVGFSEPGDGDEVPGPLTEVVIAFTGPVTPVGFGFEVVDESGESLIPEITSRDDTVYMLTFESPLDEGEVTVHYEVAVDDDIVSGQIGFVVGEPSGDPAPSTTDAATEDGETSVPAVTTESAGGEDVEPFEPPELEEVSTTPVPTEALVVVAVLALAAGVILLVRSWGRSD